MAKKTISLVLAAIMVLSLFAINAFAAGETATFTVTSSAAEVATDDVITITVTAASDATYYAGPMSIPVTYDATAFEYVANSVTVNDIFGAGVTDSAVNTTAGKITVAVTPLTNGSPVAPNLTTALTVFTFQLKALDGTGDYTIGIAADQKTAENPTGKFYCGSFSTSDPKTADLATIGQTLNRVDATVSFASAAEPELVAKDGYSTIIVDNNKTFGGQYAGVVYGFDIAGATINAAFYTTRLEATNGGSIAVVKTPYIARPASYGTGTTIQLKNAGGDVIKTYVVVIFGDISGDGKINATDTGLVFGHVQAAAVITDEVKLMACNVVESGRTAALKATSLYQVRADDTGAIYAAVQGTAINQGTVAAKHNSYNTYYQ